MSSPAEPGYAITKLFQEISDLKAAVKRLEQTPPPVYVEQATVYSYSFPNTYCVVEYDSGGFRTAGVLEGYTPAPGARVEVFNLPGRVFILKTL